MEAYIKYKLVLGLEGIYTRGTTHEALSRDWWRTAPRAPRLWEKDELITSERTIKTQPITFDSQSTGRNRYSGMGGYI
eukprot:6214496-Pleurochrysis_carterae.AAC.3